jgi:hypothetical protein
MNWQDYLALALFAAATAVVAWRAYRAIFGRAKAGCASGCGSCSSTEPVTTKNANLLSIGPPLGERKS